MIRVSFCLLFLAIIYPSYAQKSDPAAAEEEALVEVAAGAALEVRCRLAEAGGAAWRRDGRAEVTGARAEELADGALWAVLRVPHAAPQHAGRYTCARPPAHAVLVRVSGAEQPLVQYYDVHRPFSINCTLPNPTGLPVLWYKNETEVSAVAALKDRAEVRGDVLDVRGKSSDDDHGAYRCRVGNDTREVELRGRPVAKLPPNSAAVEGQALRIKCRVLGRPPVPAVWTFSNDTLNETDVRAALGADRVRLEPGDGGAEDADLLVAEARRGDAGRYRCIAQDSAAVTTVRVKDMYAALWPFLGICAEVLLLCAVILLYERRKARPEPEDDDDHKKS